MSFHCLFQWKIITTGWLCQDFMYQIAGESSVNKIGRVIYTELSFVAVTSDSIKENLNKVFIVPCIAYELIENYFN